MSSLSAGSDHAVLLDIEGTTTPISFVHQVLFPYAAQVLEAFLQQHAQDEAVAAACRQILSDASPQEQALPQHAAVLSLVRRQMAADVKATGLKALQGLIWRHGYESGALQSEVFADVPVALRRWQAAGRAAAIYSSGSRLAQQLLFRHTAAGDLTPLLSGFFDTESGPKQHADSYRRIATAWGQPPERITFASDVPAECAAASEAGLHAVLLMRPGNPPLPANLPFAVHADLGRL